MLPPTIIDLGLFAIVLMVLLGPFLVPKIEHNLEAFLFVMGVLAVTLSSFESHENLVMLYGEHIPHVGWNMPLIMEAIEEPVIKGIVPAVLVAGLLFYRFRDNVQSAINALLKVIPLKILVFVMIVVLGLCASIITAIIAALLLVELINAMPMDRKTRVNVAIIACFSIGLGAVLTPVGEPLSTIAITKLQGEPYNAGFFFLFNVLAVYIIPGCVAMGLLGMVFTGKAAEVKKKVATASEETLKDVVVRAGKVYLFVMALLLLGSGMKIIIDKYILSIPPQIIYWVNMISAILDNATLTAAEISPMMGNEQIQAVLMGLLISGGMLIPGNIPNIISAQKLSITSKEWAKLGVPLGLVLMAIYYVWVFYIPFHIQFNLGA
jgi:predicted cation transporter